MRFSACVAVALLLASGRARAHHSFASEFDENYLKYQVTIEDSKVLTRPWTSGWPKFSLAQEDDHLLENYCTNEQNADQFRKLVDVESQRAR
ncbi:MAG: hypothetical protein HY655_01585 [Acidobacteria bacterium]|nr:hypothetical protein [Acidobacteriota bacterium]